jgi:hypothetical protein
MADDTREAGWDDDEREPTRFVYLVGGKPCVGTKDDYVKALEMSYYSGIGVSQSLGIITAGENGELVLDNQWAVIVQSEYDQDDCATVTVRVGDEEGKFRLERHERPRGRPDV